MKHRISGIILMSVVAALAVALDQLSKAWITTNVVSHEVRPIIEGWVRLRHTQNTGAAFGFFQGWTGALSFAAVVVIAAIIFFVTRTGGGSRWMLLALGLITGGALGNLIDRLRLGYVVDFIDVYGPRITIEDRAYTFPVFNTADSSITVGVILLMAIMLFGKREPEAPQPVPDRYISRSHSPWFTQYDQGG